MSSMIQLAEELHKNLTESNNRKPQAAEVKATVLRIEGDVAWVKIPNGYDETPVQRTNNANPGDEVLVRISNGRAWLIGNNTSPATDDAQANAATQLAEGAAGLARSAEDSAKSAKSAADTAWSYADTAHIAAQTAASSAEEAMSEARSATISAGLARDQATEAKEQAYNATISAQNALKQLSVVEDVSGTLDWVQTHGYYKLCLEREVIPNKTYFTLSGTAITSPVGIPKSNGWYEKIIEFHEITVSEGIPAELGWYELINDVYVLSDDTTIDPEKTYYESFEYYEKSDDEEVIVGTTYYSIVSSGVSNPIGDPYINRYYSLFIDEAVSTYIASHLALTDNALLLTKDNESGYISISNDGIDLYNADGKIASYGEDAIIGNENGFHIVLSTNAEEGRLSFYQSATEVAYISSNQLYITQSVVLTKMALGETVSRGGSGQWAWEVHLNGDNPPRNNLNLKWLG